MRYGAVDLGHVRDRVDDDIWKLAETIAFVPNDELCQSVEGFFDRYIPQVNWLLNHLAPTTSSQSVLNRPIQGNSDRVKMFTIFQAFFMGYYYEIIMRFIDTNGLQLQIVDGAWGFV